MTRRSYTLRRDVNIYADRLQGMTPEQLAEKYGLSVAKINQIVERVFAMQLQDLKITAKAV